MAAGGAERPTLRLNPGQGRRFRAGSPWVFSNEIAMQPEYRQLPPGGLVRIEADDGARFGTFMFNPRSLIAARLLDRDPAAAIDAAWLRTRLREAIALRERVCDTRFHRLVHAEADRLPGLVIDRYDDVAVLQANTAGMERLTPLVVEALTGLLPLRAVVARNDSGGAASGGAGGERGAAVRRRRGRRSRGSGCALSGRSAERAEDRMVLRPALEPRPRLRPGGRRARAGRVLPCRRVRPALRGRRRA